MKNKRTHISGIYCIENLSNSKKYIGQSKDVYNRWSKHKGELRNNTHYNKSLQKDYNESGLHNFDFYILEECSLENLDEKESYYINLHASDDPNFGYNRTTGGHIGTSFNNEAVSLLSNSIQKSYTDELKDIRRNQLKKFWADPIFRENRSGENNGMYGRHHSEESKKKMSENKKGVESWRKNHTPVYCEELDKKYNDATEASKELHIDSGGILKVCRGERKIAGGFHWHFIE